MDASVVVTVLSAAEILEEVWFCVLSGSCLGIFFCSPIVVSLLLLLLLLLFMLFTILARSMDAVIHLQIMRGRISLDEGAMYYKFLARALQNLPAYSPPCVWKLSFPPTVSIALSFNYSGMIWQILIVTLPANCNVAIVSVSVSVSVVIAGIECEWNVELKINLVSYGGLRGIWIDIQGARMEVVVVVVLAAVPGEGCSFT